MTRESSHRRFYWLVVGHVVLSAAPLLSMVVPPELMYMPIVWALFSVPIGSLMTLSVWVGLGSARISRRLLAAVAATLYVAMTFSIVQMISDRMTILDSLKMYSIITVAYLILVLLIGGMFGLLGRRFELRLVEPHDGLPGQDRLQFSVLNVLVIMSIVALVLTLLRASRSDVSDVAGEGFHWTASDSLAFVVFLLNTLVAAYAALWPGGLKRNVGLVMVVAVLFGLVLAIASGNYQTSWWLFVGSTLIAILPTVVEIVSLLVVRSCGYRLVRRVSGTHVE